MSKEHAYAYETGYRDGSINYELEHCPACKNVADLQEVLEENAKLREQMERLVTLLRVDCDIDASWDGLRKFWYIGLTESGCLMRDRACKAEAENAKLLELCGELLDNLMPEICAKAHWCRDKDWHACNDDACGNYIFVILARELGVDE